MRFISLLLALAIIGYVIKIYLDSSSMASMDEGGNRTHPQQTIERAEQATEQLNQVLLCGPFSAFSTSENKEITSANKVAWLN